MTPPTAKFGKKDICKKEPTILKSRSFVRNISEYSCKPVIPDDATEIEQLFHKHLDGSEMYEINVKMYLENKADDATADIRSKILKISQAKSTSSSLLLRREQMMNKSQLRLRSPFALKTYG